MAIFAAAKAGAVFSLINPSTKADKLAYVLNNCRARALITQAKLLAPVIDAVGQASSIACCVVAGMQEAPPLPRGIRFEDALATSVPPPAAPGLDIDLAMLVYTSGSTGFPKGVMMTHRNVVAAATSITTYLENTSEDVILNVLPISFDYGLYQVLMAVKTGATLILEKSFAFPQATFRKLVAERVTGFPIVPTLAALILQMRDLASNAFPDLRYITNTAAALPPAHIERLQELFPTAPSIRCMASPSANGAPICRRKSFVVAWALSASPFRTRKPMSSTSMARGSAQGSSANLSSEARMS